MNANDLWELWLCKLAYADNIHMLVSGRYECEFAEMRNSHRDFDNVVLCFSDLVKDNNSDSSYAYADLLVHDVKTQQDCFGRLHCTISNDILGENKYSFMLCLKPTKDDKAWTTSFSVPASGIELVKQH